MKKYSFVLCCFLFFGNSLFGQAKHFNFSAGYVYQYAPAWDEIIQTYNFSRSFNSNELNLFINGFEISGGWRMSNKSQRFELNPGISYQRFTSHVKNVDMRLGTSINSYSVHTNATWKFSENAFFPSWISLDPACAFLNPSVRINRREIQLEQTKKYHELGIAFRLGMEMGWQIQDSKHNTNWRPFLRADWYPEAELYDFASALNGSYIQDLKDYGVVFQFSAGLRLFFAHPATAK